MARGGWWCWIGRHDWEYREPWRRGGTLWRHCKSCIKSQFYWHFWPRGWHG